MLSFPRSKSLSTSFCFNELGRPFAHCVVVCDLLHKLAERRKHENGSRVACIIRSRDSQYCTVSEGTEGKVRVYKRGFLVLVVALLAAGAAQAQSTGNPLDQGADLDAVAPSASSDVRRLNLNAGATYGDSYFQSVDSLWNVGRTDGLSPLGSVPSPSASAHAPVPSEMLAEDTWPEPSEATPAPPKPPEPSDQGFHISISPYIWFAGMHGLVGALGHEASVHASFGDIFNYLNIGAMFSMEPRYNRIVMPFDFIYMKLSDNRGLPEELGFTSVKVKIRQFVVGQKIGYRVIDSEKFKIDGLVGFRYFHLGNTLTLQPQIENGFYRSANWVDVVAGAKIQAMLTPKVVVTIAGDAGGGGSNTDYQIAGFLGYKFKKFILQGGYRYLSVNYRPSGAASFIYDVDSSGLMFGATIPLK